jgi:hypothetical protein
LGDLYKMRTEDPLNKNLPSGHQRDAVLCRVFFFLRKMVGRYLPRFDETVSFFLPAPRRKKKEMNKVKLSKERLTEGNNFDTQTFDTNKFLLVFKNKYSRKENNLCVET